MRESMASPRGLPFRFGEQMVREMLFSGMLVDGRSGGLVVGPSHEQGNIYLLYRGQPGQYGIIGSMEGGEYLVSHAAYLLFKDRLDTINAWEHPSTVSSHNVDISARTRIINVYAATFTKAILIDPRGQFIVNKVATGRFFSEIEDLNYRAERHCIAGS